MTNPINHVLVVLQIPKVIAQLIARVDDQQRARVILQRAPEHDEPLRHQRVHERRMLGEALLLIELERVIPRSAAAAGDCEVAHSLTVEDEASSTAQEL